MAAFDILAALMLRTCSSKEPAMMVKQIPWMLLDSVDVTSQSMSHCQSSITKHHYIILNLKMVQFLLKLLLKQRLTN